MKLDYARVLKTKILLFSAFLVMGLSSTALSIEKTNPQELLKLERFLKYLMIEQHGIFTLLGTKPLTAFQITSKGWEEWLNNLPLEEKEGLVLYVTKKDLEAKWFSRLPKKTQEKAIITETELNTPLEGFDIVREKCTMKKYLIFEGTSFHDEKNRAIYFFNILQTILALKKNYTLFKTIFGKDFSPLEVVFELEAGQSEFWTKLFANPEGLGILFGYGEQNSWLWSLQFEKSSTPKVKVFKDSFFNRRKSSPPPIPKRIDELTIDDLDVPRFISFLDRDKTVEDYKKSLLEIKETYKGKNFLHYTLKKLESDF